MPMSNEQRRLLMAGIVDALNRTAQGAVELDAEKVSKSLRTLVTNEEIALVMQDILRDRPDLVVTKAPGGQLALARAAQTQATLGASGMQILQSAGMIFDRTAPINTALPKGFVDPSITPEQQEAAAREYRERDKPRIALARLTKFEAPARSKSKSKSRPGRAPRGRAKGAKG